MEFRVRAAAIIINNESKLLLVHHKVPGTGEEWWAPPGGGIEGSESALEAVIREVREECGIYCTPKRHIYTREFLDFKENIHHVELFFTAEAGSYDIKIGSDPELSEQLITDVRFCSGEEISSIEGAVYPNILRDLFWEDLKKDFLGHRSYLGQHIWR